MNTIELYAFYGVRCQIEGKLREVFENKTIAEISIQNYRQMLIDMTEQLQKQTRFKNFAEVEAYLNDELKIKE